MSREGTKARRLGIAGLSAAGVLDALYMLAFDEGLLDSLWCPFLGDQCAKVGRSEHARHLGVPNAAVGAVGYAAMGALALWGGTLPAAERPLRSAALTALAGAASAASLYLLWEQKSKIHAYCFWCLLSTGISLSIFGLALPEVSELGSREVTDVRKIAENLRQALHHPHGPKYQPRSA